MATQSQSKTSVTEKLEGAAARVGELNEKTLDKGRKASIAYLDTYEKTVVSLADSYEKAFGATGIDWLTSVAATQAKATCDVTKAYTTIAREVVS
jgi:hypothetical protein